jgi:hypothetical protein
MTQTPQTNEHSEGEMAITVNCYGIHRAPTGIAFLEQGRGGTNALGSKDRSPFTVRLTVKQPCNHLVALAMPAPARRHLEILDSLPIKKIFSSDFAFPAVPEALLVDDRTDPRAAERPPRLPGGSGATLRRGEDVASGGQQ